jgi:hypothetical protein
MPAPEVGACDLQRDGRSAFYFANTNLFVVVIPSAVILQK